MSNPYKKTKEEQLAANSALNVTAHSAEGSAAVQAMFTRLRSARRPVKMTTIDPGVTRDITARLSRLAASESTAQFAGQATRRPALIPHEVAGSSRPYPAIPATRGAERLLLPGIPADARSARKRQDRPVTPEVAGSSPVAPVFRSACKSGGCVAAVDGSSRPPGPFVGPSPFERSLQNAGCGFRLVIGRTNKIRSLPLIAAQIQSLDGCGPPTSAGVRQRCSWAASLSIAGGLSRGEPTRRTDRSTALP